MELIVDSFAGGGGASTGIEMALGRSPDYAINHDREALALHAANHPDTVHLSENIYKVDPMDVVGRRAVGLLWASPDCFPAGTLVLTITGYRPIEDVEVGDLVLSHAGVWRAVTEISSTVRPVVTLKGHGHPGLTLSVEHPVFARHRQDVWSTEAPRGYRRTLEPSDWIPASMLGQDWYWAAPLSFPASTVPEVGGRGFPIDAEFMWLVGRYLGDGWTRLTEDRAELVITCGHHETAGLRNKLSLWAKTGIRAAGGELTWHERDTSTAHQFSTNHRGFVEWLRQHFGHRAEAKRIPGWALGMERELKDALLGGYLSADGWNAGAFAEARTVSNALAFGLKALLNSTGKTVTIHRLANSATIEGRQVVARPINLLRWRHDVAEKHAQTFRDDLHEWCPIREQQDNGDIAEVFNIGVEVDESYVVEGIVVHNCKHFSKAKGGAPVKRNIRDLAWTVVLWAERAKPRVIILENVEEFQGWGPLVENAKGELMPCPDRRGETFAQWVAALKKLGYAVEWRELRACDYGAPTTRKRLFVIARRDRKSIVWPTATHAAPGKDARLLPYRTAASDVIDWSIPCPSIFDSSEEIMQRFGVRAVRPLAEATLARIAKGVKRYVIDAVRPFIVDVAHGEVSPSGVKRWGTGSKSVDVPMGNVTAGGVQQGVVVPLLSQAQQGGSVHPANAPHPTVTASPKDQNQVVAATLVGCGGRAGQSPPRGVDRPTGTGTTKADACLVAATMVQTGYGEREGQEPRALDIEKPLGTVVAGGAKHAVVAAHISRQFGASVGHAADDPLASTTAGGGGKSAVVAAFLAQHNTDMVGHHAEEPLSTIVQKGSTQAIVSAGLLNLKGSDRRMSDVEEPSPAVTSQGNHLGEVRAFLMKYYGVDQDPRLEEPLSTVTTRDRFGIVMVNGEPYQITDIGMRMLTPRELFKAQGFPADYEIETGVFEDGERRALTKTAQVRMCGNSVCPPIAAALVAANCNDLAIANREAAE